MAQMQRENDIMRQEIEALVFKYEALKKFAAMKKIPIPADLQTVR